MRNKKKQNFIRTMDADTATLLLNLGYRKIDEQNGVYTFLNDGKLNFSDDVNMNKVQFSNMLCF